MVHGAIYGKCMRLPRRGLWAPHPVWPQIAGISLVAQRLSLHGGPPSCEIAPRPSDLVRARLVLLETHQSIGLWVCG